jgi:hypothetical protein
MHRKALFITVTAILLGGSAIPTTAFARCVHVGGTHVHVGGTHVHVGGDRVAQGRGFRHYGGQWAGDRWSPGYWSGLY